MQNQSVVCGASSASCRITSSSTAASAKSTITTSNQCSAREVSESLHGLNVLDARAQRLLPG